MTVDHFPITARKHWNLEAKFPDAAAQAIDGRVVLAGIAGIQNQPAS
jgi:hypothetical protein